MTIHKKAAVSSNVKETAKNELASSTSSETYEVVSSTSVVEESRQMTESEVRSSAVEMTSASREVIMDSKGNIIKVIETPPQTVQRSSSSQRSGKSSQDLIAGEQMRSIKQAKTAHEIARESVDRNVQGKTIGQSVETQASHSTVQQSVSSSSSKSSTSEDRKSVSNDVRNAGRAPVIQTSSRCSENTRASSETSEAVTRDGQTVSSTTRILETGEKIDDNGRLMSTSSREIGTEHAVTPSNVAAIGNTDDTDERSGDKSTRSESKSDRSNVEISGRCNKPGQSTWDGTFVYESTSSPRSKVVDKSSKARDDSETSVKVTREASAIEEEISVIDQVVSSTSTVTRDSKTIIDEGQLSTATRFRDSTATSDKVVADTTNLMSETHAKEPVRYSRPGDSAWDGSFVMEKFTTKPKRRNDSDAGAFHHDQTTADNVVETTRKTDFREKSTDGTYERESSETVRVVKGATDNSRFISEERRDVSRESSIHVDDLPSSSRESPQRRAVRNDSAWNGEFVHEKPQDDARNVTVVRRTEKQHDSVDVQDVTEEQNVSNVSESVSTSYIVEYAISSDKRNVEKITSVSDVIPEEDGADSGTVRRQSGSPERQPRSDTTSRCYKPGQSSWDGTFVHERPLDAPRRVKDDKRATKMVDIRDVTEDNSINEADIMNTSYIVEHSSSQQSFSDVRDASLTSTIYETVVHEGRPVETTIRFNEGTSRSKTSTTERQVSVSPRPGSPEKAPRDKDAARAGKPGKSSTRDGTFVPQRSHEKKRPPSRELSTDKLPDKPHRANIEARSPDASKGHVEEAIVDVRDITREKSSTSEMTKNSIVMEQSRRQESYADSSNVDFSMTSMETVIIRDGQPITTQKAITIEESPHSPAKRLTEDTEVIITADVKESTVKSPEKRKPQSDDRAYRPAKPGSSTWDGSFVYEKPETKSPADRRTPKDAPGIVDKRSPIGERPDQIIDQRSSVAISDTSRDVKSSSDHATSSVTIERTFVSDSKTRDSANASKTFIEDRTENYEKPRPSPRQRPSDDSQAPKDEKPRKSPVERAQRPSKPGASTWDGSFVYEKPQDSRKPTTGGPAEEPTRSSSEGKPVERAEKPITTVRRSTDEKLRQDAAETRYIEDVADISRADITRTSQVLQQSSYVIDQSASFTSVHDVRNVADERVITEFTKDTRKDAVSNSERHEMVSLLPIHAAFLVSRRRNAIRDTAE